MKSSASATSAVPKMAEDIAYYSVYYVAKLESPVTLDAPLQQMLDRLLDSVSSENMGFTNFLTSLNLNKDNCCLSLRNIFDEMLSDQRLNWGRILTIYCFSGCTAKHLVEKGCSSEVARQIARTCGDFVTREMSTWIAEQGGWVSNGPSHSIWTVGDAELCFIVSGEMWCPLVVFPWWTSSEKVWRCTLNLREWCPSSDLYLKQILKRCYMSIQIHRYTYTRLCVEGPVLTCIVS